MSLPLTEKIYNILVSKGYISEKDLKKAKEIHVSDGGSLGDILVKMKAISKNDLLMVVSESLGFPPIDIARIHISSKAIALIPERVAISHLLLPISQVGNQLTVAMVDPLNIFALDDIKVLTKMHICPVLADEEGMRMAFRKYFEKTAGDEISSIMDDMRSDNVRVLKDKKDSAKDVVDVREDAPVIKLINIILSQAIKEGASDIFIEPMEHISRIRYRVDGILAEKFEPPNKFHYSIVSRIKVMSNLDIAEKRLPQDGRFRLRLEDRSVDFRVSIVPSSMGEKVALRILDKHQAMIDLDVLGFLENDISRLREAGRCPHGMILVCGPTGSGKTTTLYSILNDVDDPAKNVITVEDPVEYELGGINQVSIREDIGLTFSACLRSILRQDPDIIMVGEIRDYDTLDIAVKSALTGHLVLSTIHTNTAAGAIVRMVNMGIESFLLASSVELIAAQRLIRKLCPDCKEPYRLAPELAKKFRLLDAKGNPRVIYKPVGCKRCSNSGYRGRIGIMESFRITPRIKELIFNNAQETEIEKEAKAEGMTTLRENGMMNIIEGTTSLEEVLRATIEREEDQLKENG